MSNTVPLYTVIETFEYKKLEAASQSQNSNISGTPSVPTQTQETRPAMQAPQTYKDGQEQTGPKKSMFDKLKGNVFSLIIGLVAAYLSWTCNTTFGVSFPLKIIYALFAYIFGLFYIIIYFIFLKGKCEVQQAQNLEQM